MNTPVASPTPPSMRALLDSFKQEIFQALNCHRLGTIVSFDANKQTASVQVSSLFVFPNGKTSPYPVLTDCPVSFPSGGGARITFPIAAGDPCLVLFHDTDIDNWFVSGNLVVPNTIRSHDLSDGLVLVGFHNAQNRITDYSASDLQMRFGSGIISIDPTGNISLQTPASTIVCYTSGEVSLANTSGLRVGGVSKVQIQNSSGSLLSALDALCTALTSWINTGGSTPNATTIAAIAAVKTSIDALLQ